MAVREVSAVSIRITCPKSPIPTPPYSATFRLPMRFTTGMISRGTMIAAKVEHIIMERFLPSFWITYLAKYKFIP